MDGNTLSGETGDPNRTCRHCGAHVSARFARVFGNNDGQIYACLDCSTSRELRRGGGLEGDQTRGI